MSLVPQFKATLEDNLGDKERQEIVDQIKAVKGVLSARFNSSSGQVLVTYMGAGAMEETRKIPGVKSATPVWRM